jgi:putative SOS response-associated peptidase YedK
MCGRFTLITTPEMLARQFGLDADEGALSSLSLHPRFNIAPSQPALVLRARAGAPGRPGVLEPVLMQWGLVPSWSQDAKGGARMINARADSVAGRPAYRSAIKRRRCLVPASGFYEWQKQGKGKQPHYIRVRGGGLFAFAGLWELWTGGGESALETFTVITTDANALVAPLHERMPAILKPESYKLWTDPTVQSAERLTPLLAPYDAEAMESWPVGPHVNAAVHDVPECIRPLEDAPPDDAPTFL